MGADTFDLPLDEGGGKSFNVWEERIKKDPLSALLLSKNNLLIFKNEEKKERNTTHYSVCHSVSKSIIRKEIRNFFARKSINRQEKVLSWWLEG